MNKLYLFFITIFWLITISCDAQFNTIERREELKGVSLYTDKVYEDVYVDQPKIEKDTIKPKDTISYTPRDILCLPLKKIRITSHYGMRFHPIDRIYKKHSGIDLRANKDTVYAVHAGTVLDSGYSKDLGYFIKIGFNDYLSIYGHLQQYFVKKGNIIRTGDKIGITGSTGKSTAEHLHYSLRIGDDYIDPIRLIRLINRSINK